MIRLFLALLTLWPGLAVAEPLFINRSDALPAPHVYDGGWEHFVGGGVAVFDCNGDAFPDIFAAGGANPSQLYENIIGPNDWRFRDAGFDAITGVTGAYPLDVNNDGLIDLFVLRVGSNHIYRGLGNCRFKNADNEWGFDSADRWSTAFSATWEAGRDWPTLAVGNYVDRANPDGPFGACDVNELYRPSGRRYGTPEVLKPGFCALSMLFSDWSRSGHADLRISNDRHYYVVGGTEQMYRLDEGRFLGPEDGWKPISIWGMGIASQDITGDLRPDIMLTSMADQLMQLSTRTGFAPAPFTIGTYAQRPFKGDDGRPSTGWHAEFEDVDNDGFQDLFIAKGNVDQMPSNAMKDPNNLLMQQPDGTFREMGDVAGIATTNRSRGAALADFDNDGRLDLVVVNRRAPMEIYQNATPESGNWLTITPRQDQANTFAVGGWIEVRDRAGHVQTKELTVGGGHAGGQAGSVHFGLGAEPIAEVRILWPDGGSSDWITLPANDHAELWRRPFGGVHVVQAE
ncbi:MAG: CRTAC1 family protein [Paracoccaceae bacterium]